jgi:hypothetical protein
MAVNSEEGDEGGRVGHKQDDSSEMHSNVDSTRRHCMGRRISTYGSNERKLICIAI